MLRKILKHNKNAFVFLRIKEVVYWRYKMIYEEVKNMYMYKSKSAKVAKKRLQKMLGRQKEKKECFFEKLFKFFKKSTPKHAQKNNRQRRKMSVKKAEKDDRRNPFGWCA